jgi:hypothetical protein
VVGPLFTRLDSKGALPLVVRFQHLHPLCIGREANAGNTRTTGKFMTLVEFSNFTFDPADDIEWVSNVKFIPLGRLGASGMFGWGR